MPGGSSVDSAGLRRRGHADEAATADQTHAPVTSNSTQQALNELKEAHTKQQNAALAAQLNGAVAALDTVPEWPWIPLVLTIVAAFTRYWRLDRPPAVVFDEHHFGRFTNQYWKGEYFFDIHPPLGEFPAISATLGFVLLATHLVRTTMNCIHNCLLQVNGASC